MQTYKQRNRDLAKENADLRAALADMARKYSAALRILQDVDRKLESMIESAGPGLNGTHVGNLLVQLDPQRR